MNYIIDKFNACFIGRTASQKEKICQDITNRFEKCLTEYENHKSFHACVKHIPFDFFHKNCTNKLEITSGFIDRK